MDVPDSGSLTKDNMLGSTKGWPVKNDEKTGLALRFEVQCRPTF